MAIPEKEIYPRTGDRQTIYLRPVITDPNITVGEYTMYNDFVHDPADFQTNNVLYHYPVNGDRLTIGKFCSIACGAKFPDHREVLLHRLRGKVPLYQRQPHHALPVHLPLPPVF